ncbi:UNVERIFIED_CONTAM: Zinc-finger homeodomain protein 4 [Sesamum calycinum]|uniref:Zinc-finger homeodomain protein 4 n=1 Tax=Sesamum calycinum TaxID=2727403 RepID=A0AAW2PLZ4_9LAMI
MELPSHQEGDEMPIPMNSMIHHHGHGHGHMIHHHDPASHIIPSSGGGPPHQIPSNGPPMSDHDHDHDHDHVPFKKMVRYRECLKNHAASMGGNATDGCGEFMPSGEEGTLEALTCSACNCHRNFHRKEVEGEPSSCDGCSYPNPRMGRKLFMAGHHNALAYHHHHHHGGPLISSRPVPPHQMIMSYNMAGSLPSESDEHEDGGGGGGGGVMVRQTPVVKKRFRTKFTQEQKEKMLSFAEKVGWKIQKQEESVVQQFCQEVGVKRRVLKVWMHNNKHNLAKKNLNHSNPQNQV